MVKRKGGRQVVVGYDGRLSSVELEAALVQGLASTGLEVVRVGLGPTPLLYFAQKHLDADAGVMITGSHNPPEYNASRCGGAAARSMATRSWRSAASPVPETRRRARAKSATSTCGISMSSACCATMTAPAT